MKKPWGGNLNLNKSNILLLKAFSYRDCCKVLVCCVSKVCKKDLPLTNWIREFIIIIIIRLFKQFWNLFLMIYILKFLSTDYLKFIFCDSLMRGSLLNFQIQPTSSYKFRKNASNKLLGILFLRIFFPNLYIKKN